MESCKARKKIVLVVGCPEGEKQLLLKSCVEGCNDVILRGPFEISNLGMADFVRNLIGIVNRGFSLVPYDPVDKSTALSFLEFFCTQVGCSMDLLCCVTLDTLKFLSGKFILDTVSRIYPDATNLRVAYEMAKPGDVLCEV